MTCTTNGGSTGERRSSIDPLDRGRAGGRQRVAQQPLETDLVGWRAGVEHPVPVRQPVAPPQDAPGAVVGRDDVAPPVQVENAYPRVVEQGGHGRVPRFGADQRLPDPDELPDMGQQPRDHRDPRRPPAIRVDGVAEGPGDVGAVRPVETRVHRVLLAGPGEESAP